VRAGGGGIDELPPSRGWPRSVENIKQLSKLRESWQGYKCTTMCISPSSLLHNI
jgi:hypothetical protein